MLTKRRISLILISLFFIIYSGFSQGNEKVGIRILFTGLVMDASDLSPIANSQILINRYFSSVSGNDGTFAFYVTRNDTVVFKRLGYKSATMYISDTLTGNEFVAGVYMSVDTLMIGEVIIVPRLTNFRSELLNAGSNTPAIMENARYNLAISAYQGRNSQSKLGDPSSNYEILRQQQKVQAYERGGIPSEKIAGINPLLLMPAAYLLIHGFPERPDPMKSHITNQELDQIHKKYLETLKKQ